ncbi:MAG: RimK family alpha-L-glutamate ligase [Planctomycetota bacterium]
MLQPPSRPLKIAILSSGKTASTPRLKQAFAARGHKVRVLAPEDLRIDLSANEPQLLYHGKPLNLPDVVVPRIPSSKTFFGVSLVAQFEQMGVFTLNSSQAIQASRNKLRALQKLSRHGIGLPETVFFSGSADARAAIAGVGGVPVIIKLLEGTQGIGVMLAESQDVAMAILETLRKTGQDALVQRFVSESRGKDVRALVVGGRVLGAVRRQAAGTEFRSNIHRGGEAVRIDLPPDYERTAVAAAQVLGLHVAGVDMLESEQGPLLVEVNSSPSIDGMEGVTGLDLAGPIVELVEQRAHVKPLDVVQRLSLQRGYGVAELNVSPKMAIAGKPLSETGLREAGLQVLYVTRGSEVFPGPRGTFVLEPGDAALMFGPLEAIKAFLPAKPPRKPVVKNGG